MEIRIIRKIDKLGRIVIPMDVRKTLGLSSEDEVEITVKENAVILRKSTEESAENKKSLSS